MNLINNYDEALEAIYKHVGFEENWVVCPLDTESAKYYWYLDKHVVHFAQDPRDFENEAYYSDEIYTQRFYNKWVYEGEKYTMIFCDPRTDGMKWFRLFTNEFRLTENPLLDEE